MLAEIYLSNKTKVFCLMSTSCLEHACSYDDEWCFAARNYVLEKIVIWKLKFLHPNGPSWASHDSSYLILIYDIIKKVDPVFLLLVLNIRNQ